MSPVDDAAIERAVVTAVQDLLANDVTIVAAPALIARVNCPVWQRVGECVKDPDWGVPEGVLNAPLDDLAVALRLPPELLETYPVVDQMGVAVSAIDELGFADVDARDLPGGLVERVHSAVLAWAEAQKPSVRPHVAPAGRESDFEAWLVDHLRALGDWGFVVRLADVERDGRRGRQVRLHRQSTADLVCRFSAACPEIGASAGDWLVIENKTVPVGQHAAWQLARYVDLLQAQVPEKVHGLLIADGASVNLGRALRERGFSYLSLVDVGYRAHLRGLAQPQEWEPSPESLVDADGTRADVIVTTLDS